MVINPDFVEERRRSPMGARYGKIMMWFFIVSDSLTFAGFLVAYGFMRYQSHGTWPIADEVFTHFPFLHGHYPMLYVALMSFILIVSSVTMVLAVDAGHKNEKNRCATWMFLTILGGLVFLLSQAWEWSNFISGSHGAMRLKSDYIALFVDNKNEKIAISDFISDQENDMDELERVRLAFSSNKDLNLRVNNEFIKNEDTAKYFQGAKIVRGANLIENEYGHTTFANFFYFITGFHGVHVFTGVLLNFIIFCNVLLGTFEKSKDYEMVEKVGLYWHFVDLVWVFVFTFFYLI
nr:cytochrome c oxidase subunit 3 [Ichthyobacterium seriolicida]